MNYIIVIPQIVVSIVLTVLILLQSKGGGLGSAFGSTQYHHTRRGADKAMFQATIALAIAFVVLSLAAVLL